MYGRNGLCSSKTWSAAPLHPSGLFEETPITRRTPAAAWLVEGVAAFSVLTHFEGFQKGVLDSRDLVFFGSVIGFALFVTGVILRGHRAG